MQRLFPVLALVGLTGFSLSPLSAAPEEETSTQEKVFQQLDKNADGTISADEVPEGKQRFFEFLLRSGDKNKDGQLTKDEFTGGLKKEDQKFEPEAERRFDQGPRFYNRFLSQLDRNGDKKISKDELPEPLRERMEPLFQRLNTDEISLEQMQRMGRMFGNGRPPRSEGANMNSQERAGRFFKSLDTNGDDKLTLDEAPERIRPFLKRLYERAGKDGDAELTREEFMKVMAEFRPAQRPERQSRERNRKPAEEDGEMKRPEMQMQERSRPRFGTNFPRSGPAFIRSVDQNGDGKLSKEELQQINRWFDEVDRNRDGFLDRSEIAGGESRSRQRTRNPLPIQQLKRPAADQPENKSKTEDTEKKAD